MTSRPQEPMKVLLLENISPVARTLLEVEGFEVQTEKGALSEAELIRRVADVHLLGIRSKTRVTPAVLEAAPHLHAVGCFCIGTNQVALDAARVHGVPVFNAPFSNTRSVAELVIAEVIALSRQLADRSREVHAGQWRKVAAGCHEVRGRTLGIIGYGHIGSQVGVLAEAIGLRVVFYDIATKLPMGNNRSAPSLKACLEEADFVTLHVPATSQTNNMIGPAELTAMKRGAYLINASRGNVVDIEALAGAIRSGHLAGAAVDVYPEEPETNSDGFESPLCGLPNVILTPHVGGSTEEAQEAIGREVATSLLKFMAAGTTSQSVNFPQLELPPTPGTHRMLNVHRNQPGVLRDINKIVSDLNANIEAQVLATDAAVGYLVMDIGKDVSADLQAKVSALSASIRTRVVS